MTTLTYNKQFHQDCTANFFQVPTNLIKLLGDRPALVLWKIHQWIQVSGKDYADVQEWTRKPENWLTEDITDHFEEDNDEFLNLRWIFNSVKEWCNQIPLRPWSIRTSLERLRELGVLFYAQFGKSGMRGKPGFDRRGWYAINYKRLSELLNAKTLAQFDVRDSTTQIEENHQSSYISINNNSKNIHNINREDAAECVSEFKSLEEASQKPQDFELPTDNSFSVGQIKQELSDKQTIPHEDQIISPPHDATQQDTPQIVEKPIIDTEVKAKRELIEGRGMVWNPKLKGMLAHYSLEQVVKAIAHMSIVHKVRNYRFTNCEGYLIDALKYEYLETTHEYLELDDEQRERLLWMVQAIAYGIAYESIILNVAATDFESPLGNWWPVEVCMKWSKKYGWRSLREEIIRQNTPPTA